MANTLQAMVDAIGEMGRKTRSGYHVTLGKMIEVLSAAVANNPETPVMLESGLSLSDPHSYRGYYSDLSFAPVSNTVTVSEMLAECKAALGETFEGYKGGDFYMGDDTPLWAAPDGCCGEAIVGFRPEADRLVIITKDVD